MTENQVTRQEWAMLSAIREGGEEFRLTISHRGGIWTVDYDAAPHADVNKARGSGPTFATAWSAMNTLAVEANPSPPLRESNAPQSNAAGVSGSHRKR